MAQLDAHPTGDQELVGLATLFRGDLLMKYSLLLTQEGQLSVSGERICTILVNRIED